jgi:hypothetical protein
MNLDTLDAGAGKNQKLKRRMSSMFPMKYNFKKEITLDPEVAQKLHELFERFPNPPEHLTFPQVIAVHRLFLCSTVHDLVLATD